MKPTIVIDCSYLCHQAKHTLKGLTFNHMDTNIIFGFMYRVLSLAKKFDTNRLVFAWDSRASIRKEKFPGYKKARKEQSKTEAEIEQDNIAYIQFNRLRSQVLPDFGFRHIIRQKGHEADDVMSAVALNNPGCILATADEDMYQCLSYCDMWKPSKKKLYTAKDLGEEHNITPDKWAEVKAIAGCSTDSVPGIKGVGYKTAIRYLNGDLFSGKIYDRIVSPEGRDIIERNRELVTLPLPTTKKFKLSFQKEKLLRKNFVAACDKYGFNSFIYGENLEIWTKKLHLK